MRTPQLGLAGARQSQAPGPSEAWEPAGLQLLQTANLDVTPPGRVPRPEPDSGGTQRPGDSASEQLTFATAAALPRPHSRQRTPGSPRRPDPLSAPSYPSFPSADLSPRWQPAAGASDTPAEPRLPRPPPCPGGSFDTGAAVSPRGAGQSLAQGGGVAHAQSSRPPRRPRARLPCWQRGLCSGSAWGSLGRLLSV